MSRALLFPKKFVWGVATAAAQIEGAATEDGKGESIWDRFAHTPGKTLNGDTPAVACDHYHRYEEDFRLMRSLGVRHYRLSIAWPRIYSQGDGAVNPAGLAYYARLLDAMKAEGITPWITLFHWDLPQALEDRGGWRSRETVEAFRVYAETVVQALASRVKNWITVNEIRCFTTLAHCGGNKAPGTTDSAQVINQTIHHALLAHGHAVRAVRQYGGKGARVGLADNPDVCIPVTETEEDILAARQWFIDRNAAILEPVYTGQYSPEYLRRCGKAKPKVQPGDLELISEPTDFLGLNIYFGTFVRQGKKGPYEALPVPPDYPRTSSPWLNITPQAIYWGTLFAYDVYGAPAIYITENGCGYDDEPLVKGEVLDLHRRDYLRNYLGELHRAIRTGVPVRGYFVWSFLDNFEWQDGYTRRFGLVHVNYATQKRTPKLSARWYATLIEENRLV